MSKSTKQDYPIHVPLPVYNLTEEEKVEEFFIEDVPLELSEGIRQLMEKHSLSNDDVNRLWGRIPNVLRVKDGERLLRDAIIKYARRRHEEKKFSEYRDVDTNVEIQPLRQKKFGDIVINTHPRVRDHRAKIVVLEDDVINKEISRRLSRGVSKKQEEYRKRFDYARQCTSLYTRRPWIEDYEYTLVGFPEKVDDKYVLEDTDKTYDEIVLYKPNNLFNILNCNRYKEKRRQNGNVFVAVDENNNEVEFYLVHYLTTGKAVLQGESIFKREIDWLKFLERGKMGRVEALLATSVKVDDRLDSNMRSIGRSVLAESIQATVLDEYVLKIEESIYDFIDHPMTVRDYFTCISEIVVFLLDQYFGTYSKIFKKRVEMRVYNPSRIYELQRSEKLPEIFLNVNVSDEKVASVSNLIQLSIAEQVIEMAKRFYSLQFPTERISTVSEVPTAVYFSVPDNPGVCHNKNNIPSWQVIKYQDDKQVYCFSIDELLDQFGAGNYKNSLTGKRFDQEFIDEILNVFVNTTVVVTGEIHEQSDIDVESVPNLVSFLRSEIVSLEEQITSLPQDKLNKVCEYCREFVKSGVSSVDSSGKVVNFCDTKCLSML